jgi:transcription elongation factor GreA-like protein
VLAAGDRVTHDRLGLGRVTRVVNDDTVIVDFGTADRAVSHLKLTKL